MAILMAASAPGTRRRRSCCTATYAKRAWSEDYPWAQSRRSGPAYTEELVSRWDWEADMRMRCPSADEPMQRWWAQRMRAAATPSTVRALMDMNALVDVRDALPAVRVPTLVLHRQGDALFDVGGGAVPRRAHPRRAARAARRRGPLRLRRPDQILDAIEPFLARAARSRPRPPALAAVVAPAGPRRRRGRGRLVAAGGRRRQGPAGRPVVLFDGPATAVRAGARSASRRAQARCRHRGGPARRDRARRARRTDRDRDWPTRRRRDRCGCRRRSATCSPAPVS